MAWTYKLACIVLKTAIWQENLLGKCKSNWMKNKFYLSYLSAIVTESLKHEITGTLEIKNDCSHFCKLCKWLHLVFFLIDSHLFVNYLNHASCWSMHRRCNTITSKTNGNLFFSLNFQNLSVKYIIDIEKKFR